jgi:hypothetical protein
VIQNQLKILANATSYGIFIEVVTEDKPASLRAYGLSTFDAKVKKTEEFGEFFNPILAAGKVRSSDCWNKNRLGSES